jgi:hypothetical protein
MMMMMMMMKTRPAAVLYLHSLDMLTASVKTTHRLNAA